MKGEEGFDFIIEQLLNDAIDGYKQTEESKLLKEKCDQIHCDCETMLMEEQHEFVMECFELLSGIDGRQERYIYKRGLQDGIWLLKNLGLLS